MYTIYLFSDKTGFLDAEKITLDYKIRFTVAGRGISSGTLTLDNGEAVRNYEVKDGEATVPLDALIGRAIKVTFSTKKNEHLTHWECGVLKRNAAGQYETEKYSGREALLRARIDIDELRGMVEANSVEIKEFNKKLKAKFTVGGTK